MIITAKTHEVEIIISDFRKQGKTIGLVPTMGALHEGHLSLLNLSKAQNDITVASIFVNPTQFTEKHDFVSYPRTLENDIRLLENKNCSLLFSPETEEMYPQEDKRVFDLNGLDAVMEGVSRPGHFNGVAQIVTKLFELLRPHRAYFGEKDFQQLTIIRHLTRLMNYPVEIVPCPIIREPDGLAMSSRNRLLTPEQRRSAAIIPQVLAEAKKMRPSQGVREVKDYVAARLKDRDDVRLDYFEIVEPEYLKSISDWKQTDIPVGCLAVKVGKVRLIDNIKFS
jgi:pantoate--beta-alanine ligase